MEKTINKYGKEVWQGVSGSEDFKDALFHDVDMSWSESDNQVAFHSNIGSITVLDRVTGYGGGMRDTETGYRGPDGKFWLASGWFDIRTKNCKTIAEAIDCIKRNANNCRGE